MIISCLDAFCFHCGDSTSKFVFLATIDTLFLSRSMGFDDYLDIDMLTAGSPLETATCQCLLSYMPLARFAHILIQ